MHKYAIGVVGASGYSGIELCRILAAHPGVEVRFVASDRWEGVTVRARTGIGGAVGALAYVRNAQALEASQGCAAVLLATPAEVSLELAPALLERGVQGGRPLGRLPPRRRGCVPDATTASSTAPPPCSPSAVYGLPELADGRPSPRPDSSPTPAATRPPRRSRWLRCCGPGCSPTSRIVIDAASGVTGAGRQATEEYSFCEVADDFRAYKVLRTSTRRRSPRRSPAARASQSG